MKKIALSMFLAILLFFFPQTLSTSPGSGGMYVFERTWGSYGTEDGLLKNPRSVAVDSDGNVYVADTTNHRIQKFDSFGGFLTNWGSYGSGDGQFKFPWGVCVDSDNNVYVADTINQRIQKFDSNGGFLGWIGLDNDLNTGWHDPGTGTYGIFGTGDGQFYNPYDVAVDIDGNIYVADTYSHRIQKFDSFGVFLGWWGYNNLGITGWHDPGSGTRGYSGSQDGQFIQPRSVAVDSDGSVYVTDTYNYRIQKFDSFGGFLTNWGSYGTGDGQFKLPWGVCVDSDNNVYVADTINQRIQKFASSGGLLGWWGYDNLDFIGWHLPGTGAYGIFGTGDGQFYNPYDVAVDIDGNIYVADTYSHRIQKFDLVPPLGITFPNGGEILLANTIHYITWDTGVGNVYVKIEFSHNNGTDWEEIVASTENNGLYEDWYVPCNLSAECLVRITGLDDSLSDVSDDVFSIESSKPPMITLIGPSEINLECGTGTYEELGATAEDGCRNDVPVVIKGANEVDTMTCGTYEITYDAIDDTGQAATQVTRTVIVHDTTPPLPDVNPLPTLEGECSVVIETAPTATDSCVGPIEGTAADSLPIAITGEGTHTVLWTYDDGNGNITTQTQIVNIIDVTPPVPDVEALPILEGECSVEITTAPTATDSCAGSIEGVAADSLPLTITGKGTHTVIWKYDDGNGNVTEQTQIVKVEDVTPPTVHLSDSTCVDVSKYKVASMVTVSASDNCSSDVELVIDKVKILNKGGRQVWGRGIYKVVGNDIYVFPNGRDWSIVVTVTASDSNGNTTTDSVSKPLLQCNRWSAQMARLIRLIYMLLWKWHRCW